MNNKGKVRKPRTRRRSPYGRIILYGLTAILLVFALIFSLQYISKTVAWRFIPLERAYAGVLEDRLALKGYIARKEQVLVAPASGWLMPVVQEGERVPEGKSIADLIPVAVEPQGQKKIEIIAPFAGQVSYHTDGLENVLQPEMLENINYRELEELVRLAIPFEARGQVKAGISIIRLANNLQPLRIVSSVQDWPAGWHENRKLTIVVSEFESEVQAKIIRMQDQGEAKVVIMEIALWNTDWLKPRSIEMDVILNTYQGMIIPEKALSVNPDGETGVYVLGTKGFTWQPVTVVGRVGNKAAVTGVTPGLEFAASAKWVRWVMK